MKVIEAMDVERGMRLGVDLLARNGILRDSRNGPVIVNPGPVTTLFLQPQNRVMFGEDRDANPFFHYLESLWMLAGYRNIAPLVVLLPSYANYSDDGTTANGAYGYRWRTHFRSRDQLKKVVAELAENPMSRRCVVGMWDPRHDLGLDSKDLPCNTQIFFSMGGVDEDYELEMTVTNRSNDIIWGLYGANAVHFSILHEYMAALLNVTLGRYWHVSNNFHAYTNLDGVYRKVLDGSTYLTSLLEQGVKVPETYHFHQTRATDLFPEVNEEAISFGLRDQAFLDEIVVLMSMIERDYVNNAVHLQFFATRLGLALWSALKMWRITKDYDSAIAPLGWLPEDCDWRLAAEQWLGRRRDRLRGTAIDAAQM